MYINRVLAHDAANGTTHNKDVLESETCIFFLADSQGVVVVDPHQRRLSLCSLAGQVEGQLEFDSIVRVSRVIATAENKIDAQPLRAVEDFKAPGNAEKPEKRRRKRSLEENDAPVNHCARLECVNGKELEIWLQDSMQCHYMVTILEAYILGEHDSSIHDTQSTDGVEIDEDSRAYTSFP